MIFLRIAQQPMLLPPETPQPLVLLPLPVRPRIAWQTLLPPPEMPQPAQ